MAVVYFSSGLRRYTDGVEQLKRCLMQGADLRLVQQPVARPAQGFGIFSHLFPFYY